MNRSRDGARGPARRTLRVLARCGVLAAAGAVLLHSALAVLVRPSLERPWSPDQAILPVAEFTGGSVTVRNVRTTRYRSVDDYDPAWEDRTYRLDDLESIWFAVEPFPGFPGAAHTLLSFGFSDGSFLAASVEIRKERGETFSAWKGLLRQFELMYVLADERDVLGLRANHRGHPVYLFPVRSTPEHTRNTFLSVLKRVNALAERPEFYHTVLNNCTTNLVRHANEAVPGRIPFSRAFIFPALSARRAYDLGLVDTELPFPEAGRRFLINERALRFADHPGFSRAIRGADPTSDTPFLPVPVQGAPGPAAGAAAGVG